MIKANPGDRLWPVDLDDGSGFVVYLPGKTREQALANFPEYKKERAEKSADDK